MDATHPRDVGAELSILSGEVSRLREMIGHLTTLLTASPVPVTPPRESLRARRDRLEGRAILLLREHGGNRKLIAETIGVPLTTLRYWPKFDAAYRYCIALDQADRISRSTGIDSDEMDLE